jgi:putative transposase
VKILARALELSQARVYYILKHEVNMQEKESKTINEDEITAKIKEIVGEYSYYGYRKVYAILKYREGISVHRNKVYKIMKKNNMLMPATRCNKKFFKGVPFGLNVEAKESNRLWGIDMTYIWCGKDAWCYFHGVIDHHDKALLGYNFSRSCGAIGGVMALSEAASKRPVNSLELRSDNGCHYGAKVFRDEIRRLGIRHTRTMVNTPKGNAIIERFFKSLKQECVWQHRFASYGEAKVMIDKYVEYYNRERPHQSLAYEAPQRFYEQGEYVEKIA